MAKPLKETLHQGELVGPLGLRQTELDAKTVKTVLAHLENTVLSAVHKKGAGEFTLPGLLKVHCPASGGDEEALRQEPVHR
ncbi:hypothetical protein ACU4GD_14190 [Cupriavidus basilensis]